MPLYRVEHHHDTHITPLGSLETAFAHHTTLDPYLRPLLEAGSTGWLLLIDEASGLPVARRRVFLGSPSHRVRCRVKPPAHRIA